MAIYIFDIPDFDGDPNGKIPASPGALFYKSGSYYSMTNGGPQPVWERVLFQNKRRSSDPAQIPIESPGCFTYIKEQSTNSKQGWKLYTTKDTIPRK